MASGIVVLPLLLNKLSADEVGMNYLMLTIGTLVSLFDFGFSPQFSRTITYVFSGAQVLRKEGIVLEDSKKEINYHLLRVVIETAHFIYKRISLIVFAIMITFGTVYIYYVTDGFTNINNSFIIWIIYSISVYFNIYYIYYTSLLTGAALITESKKAMIYSKIAYIVIAYILLLCNVGLLSVVIANFISPFVSRYYSYFKFYTPVLKTKINSKQVEKNNIKEAIIILWPNAKKLGINFLGSYAISKAGIFIAGFYLSLSEIGSLGLMYQLNNIIVVLSTSMFTTYLTEFNRYRVQGEMNRLLEKYAFTMFVFYALYIIGSLGLIFFGNLILSLFSSNTLLPNTLTLVLFSLVIMLEQTHSCAASMIVTKNEVPFVKAAIFSGIVIVVFTFIFLKYTTFGIMGIVLVQGIVQLAYNNWKWPNVVMRDFQISYVQFLKIGVKIAFCKLKYYL